MRLSGKLHQRHEAAVAAAGTHPWLWHPAAALALPPHRPRCSRTQTRLQGFEKKRGMIWHAGQGMSSLKSKRRSNEAL